MFKTDYDTVQVRNASQPEWGADINVRLFKLGKTKRQIAYLINANYTQLCSVISGTRIDLSLKERIKKIVKHLELKKEKNNVSKKT